MWEPALPDIRARVPLKWGKPGRHDVQSLIIKVLSAHDVNVVYRPEHCGQSGDISDGDDRDDGVAMCVDSTGVPCSDCVSPHLISLVIIMGTDSHHSGSSTNDRIMHVFGLIITKTNNQNSFE